MALAVDFSLAPAEALKFFRAKGLSPSFAWQDMLHEEHDRAFTVAKMMDMDLLKDVRDYTDYAIREGKTVREFIDELKPELQRRGWWGKQEMRDPATGETKEVQLGSSRRLRIIFDTNLRTAYAAGHWEQIEINKVRAPYVMYSAILDGRTRAAHAAWNGKVLRADDPWWQTHTPPNGWNCRCTVIQLGPRDLKAMGKSGPDAAPPSSTRDWANPRTGEVVKVPAGVDPGWGYAPGQSQRGRSAEALAQFAEKLNAAPHDLAAAAVRQSIAGPAFDAFYKKPHGNIPVAVVTDIDAQRIGAETHVVQLSAATMVKQQSAHGEIAAAEYQFVQDTVARGRLFQDSPHAIVYVLEDAGYVAVVKATVSGKAIFLQSFRRLPSDAARRDREIRRLIGNG